MTVTPQVRLSFEETLASMYSSNTYKGAYLFYAHIVGQLKVHFDDTMEAPAGVNFTNDHYNLYINPTMFDELPIEQRIGIIKHECLHIIQQHVHRKEDRDHQAFNYATDCAINQLIERSHLPEGCIFPDNFPGGKTVPSNLTSEQYYEHIDKDDLPKDNSGVVDDHSKWEESKGDTELQEDIAKSMLEKAMTNTQKGRGDLPSEFSDWLDNLTKKREVNWRQVLRRIAGNKRANIRKTMMRRDRRQPGMEHIKGRTKDRVATILLISDVSGSVCDEALTSLWGECRHICDAVGASIDLIQVDTSPSKPERLTKSTKSIERKACGGTILHPAIDMANKSRLDYGAIVVSTDGYLDSSDVEHFANLRKPVIWLVERDGVIMSEMTENGMKAFKLES